MREGRKPLAKLCGSGLHFGIWMCMDIRTGEIETDLLPISGVWILRDFDCCSEEEDREISKSVRRKNATGGAHADRLASMRKLVDNWISETGDKGNLMEDPVEFIGISLSR